MESVIGSGVLLPGFGVDSWLEAEARQYAHLLSTRVGLNGAFGIEFFETQKGELLVNEIAPRVHNSGHYTQNACMTDQFENHLRAVLGWPLGSVRSQEAFAMLNLLGSSHSNSHIHTHSMTLPVPGPQTYLHWYGKKESKPGRKLGHLNGVAESVEELECVLKELESCEQNWLKRS